MGGIKGAAPVDSNNLSYGTSNMFEEEEDGRDDDTSVPEGKG